jgi:transposase
MIAVTSVACLDAAPLAPESVPHFIGIGTLFYKAMNGARVGDLFMSLIHTCELNKVNPFEYLMELLRHPAELKASPAEWMPWKYRETLRRSAGPAAA